MANFTNKLSKEDIEFIKKQKMFFVSTSPKSGKINISPKGLELSKSELKSKLTKSIKEIENASKQAKKLNLKVAAGHGLNYQNVTLISKIPEVEELNIGQSIIARSVFTGLEKAIVDMRELIKND